MYESRWEVETRLLEFKQTLGDDVLRSQSVDGVLKDIWMHVLVYNLVRLLMLCHALQCGCDPRRLSFIDARDVLRYFGRDDGIPMLLLNPKRRPRDEPRVIKRRKDRYRVMTKPARCCDNSLESKDMQLKFTAFDTGCIMCDDHSRSV